MAQPVHEHVDPAHSHTASRAAVTRGAWGAMAIRFVLTLVAAAGLVVSAFMDWLRSTAGVDVNVRSLWRTTFGRPDNNFLLTVGFVVIVLGLLAIVGLAPRSGWLTRLAGALGIVVFVLFLIQVYRADLTVNDLDPGPWVALGGSVVALVGGFFGTRVATGYPAAPTAV